MTESFSSLLFSTISIGVVFALIAIGTGIVISASSGKPHIKSNWFDKDK